MTPTFWSVDDLLKWIEEHNPPLPETFHDPLPLFARMIRGLPIGTLLVQESEIVEGVEIIAAIYNALVRGYPNIALDVERGRVVESSGRQARSLLPLKRIADTMDYLDWVHELRCSNPSSQDQERRANDLVRAIREYRIPVYRGL